ncbi:MAG: hypothetical protein JWN72_2113 [Thermoleophilia bacterium]|nr:hypothetical protein [Thermoleophilia bacterium]
MRVLPLSVIAAVFAASAAPLAEAVAPSSPAGCDRRAATLQVSPDLRVPAGESDVVSMETAVAGTVTDIDLHTSTTKYSPADLTLALVAPDGTRVLLSDPTTGTAWADAGYPVWDVLWDDQAATAVGATPATVLEGANPVRPAQSFVALTGHAASGTWRLSIATAVDGSSGVLDDVTLTITSCVRATAATPAAREAPGQAASSGPTTGTPPVPGDVRPPRVHWSIAHPSPLGAQLSRPMLVDIRVDEASVIVAELRLTLRAARFLEVPVLAGTTTVVTPSSGARRIRLRFTPAVRRALASSHGIDVIVRLRVTDSSGNVRTAAKPLHLQR